MFSRLKLLLRAVKAEVHARLDPVGFARSIGVQLGEGVRLYGCRPSMWGSEPWIISIGSNVYITAGVTFVTHDGGTLILRREVPDLEWTAPITVGSDVYIGLRTIILPGVTIGSRVIIGAGSVVAKDIPDNSVAAGVPARVIRSTDEYLERMKSKSLHLGHLNGIEKDLQLRKMFGRP